MKNFAKKCLNIKILQAFKQQFYGVSTWTQPKPLDSMRHKDI